MKISLLIVLNLSAFIVFGQSNYKETNEQANFSVISDYLIKGSGKWIGDNPNYNSSNPKSPSHFGLWFEKPLQNQLSLTIVAYLKDTIRISSNGTFSYHPHQGQYLHQTADRGFGYSEGITSFPSDTSFTSIMKIYRPNGRTIDHMDENFIVDENTHMNISYRKNSDGDWVENSRWTWIRQE